MLVNFLCVSHENVGVTFSVKKEKAILFWREAKDVVCQISKTDNMADIAVVEFRTLAPSSRSRLLN